jgi:hypothetical protein
MPRHPDGKSSGVSTSIDKPVEIGTLKKTRSGGARARSTWTKISKMANSSEAAQYTTARPGLFQRPPTMLAPMPLKALSA